MQRVCEVRHLEVISGGINQAVFLQQRADNEGLSLDIYKGFTLH